MLIGLFHTDDLANLEVAQYAQQGRPPDYGHDKRQHRQAQHQRGMFHERASNEAVMRSICRPCEPLIKTTSFFVRLVFNHSINGAISSNSTMAVFFIPARRAASAMMR